MRKNESVETLRGIAIILVVIGHVIGSDATGGMKVDDNSFLRHFYFTFQYLRMPLFTVISGWVYALHPVSSVNLKTFLIKKLRRIFLPLMFVGGLYYAVQYFTPGTNFSYPLQDIWKIVIFPYTFYWYLNSLFIVFIIVALLEAGGLLKRFGYVIIVFLASMGVLLLRDIVIPEAVPNYFGFKGGLYLLPFFISGIALNRFKDSLQNRTFKIAIVSLLVIGLIFQQLVWYDVIDYDLTTRSIVGLLIGVVGTIFLLQLKLKGRFFVWMGSYAYTIYLFHSFGTSGGRIVLNKIGITNTALVFVGSLLLGLFLPVVIDLVVNKWGITRTMFLGKSLQTKK